MIFRQTGLMWVTVAVLAVVLMYGLLLMTPSIYLDVDPRINTLAGTGTSATTQADQSISIAMGPAGASILECLSVLLAAIALCVHRLAGGRINTKVCLLALVGTGVCLYHMPSHMDNLLRTGQWIAAAATAVAIYHLAQHAQPRQMILASLIALLFPMGLFAIWSVYVDHAATVENYRANLTDILASRGWERGSRHHLLYERRLLLPDAVGAFGLSNVFGGVLSPLILLAIAQAMGLLKQGKIQLASVAGLSGLLGIIALVLTDSKGAMFAFGIGVILLAALTAIQQRHVIWSKTKRLVLPGMCLLLLGVMAVIWLRGLAGPPANAQGERSLLFRYHYAQAGGAMFLDQNWRDQTLGLGMAGFANLYPKYKNPLNPEQVTSMHQFMLDYVVMLGVGGVAWVVLLVGWWGSCGKRLVEGKHDASAANGRTSPTAKRGEGDCPGLPGLPGGPGGTSSLSKCKRVHEKNKSDRSLDINLKQLGWSLCLTAAIFLTQFVFQHPVLLTHTRLLYWLLGVTGFLVTTALLSQTHCTGQDMPKAQNLSITALWLRRGLLAGGGALLAHALIEMTFFHQGALSISWLLMAVVGSHALPLCQATKCKKPGRWQWCWPALGLVLAIAVFLPRAIVLGKQQHHLATAANQLRQYNTMAAITTLSQAQAVVPIDPKVYRWQVRLHLELAQQAQNQAKANEHVQQALAVLDQADTALPGYQIMQHERMNVNAWLGMRWGDASALERALNIAQSMLKHRPYSISLHLQAADLCKRLGKADQAAQYEQHALVRNKQTYLDPQAQLDEQVVKQIKLRLHNLNPPK